MDYKKNLRYFENKKIPLYIGAAMIALGIVFLLGTRWSEFYYIMYPSSFFLLICGGIMFAVSKTSKSSDKSLDEAINESFKSFEEQTLKKFDLYERQLPYIESVLLEGYKYYEGSYLIRDGSGKYRTDVYAKTHVYFTKTELCIGSCEISFIKDEQTDKSISIPYESIKRAYMEDNVIEYKLKNKLVQIHYQTLHIETTNGEFTCQTYVSQYLDNLLENINRMAEERKN